SIGTKILMKDVMDTYLRSLGEVKTYYAAKMSMGLESFREKRPNIIFCEQSFGEGSALEFIRSIGGLPRSGDQYFVLATEQSSDDLLSLAAEEGIDEILVKPYSTETIHQIVERYFDKKAASTLDWIVDLRAARQSFLEKRFQESDELYAAAAKKYPQTINVQLDCAAHFVDRGQADKAEKLLQWVIESSAENPRALQLAGMALKKLGRYREAVDRFRRADKISPANSIRQSELAETYMLMAEELIQSALKNENENGALILKKAKHQLMRNDYVGVVTYLDAKRAFLSEAVKKEADAYTAIAKKLGGIK
ncbi:MAG: hypothetical protein ACXVBE_12940, partial [Bdellovibrionota bacterium]